MTSSNRTPDYQDVLDLIRWGSDGGPEPADDEPTERQATK